MIYIFICTYILYVYDVGSVYVCISGRLGVPHTIPSINQPTDIYIHIPQFIQQYYIYKCTYMYIVLGKYSSPVGFC